MGAPPQVSGMGGPQAGPQPGGPAAPPRNPQAMQQLAQQAQKTPQGSSSGSLLSMIMAFLAGAGVGSFAESMRKLTGLAGRGSLGGQAGQQPHRAQGVQVAGSQNPGATVTPSAAGQAAPPGGSPGPQQPAIPPQLLAMLLGRGGQG